MINSAWEDGHLNLPIDHHYNLKHPIIQYADDTLLIMPADPTQLIYLKNIMQKFSSTTGLKVNYNKSAMVPINITADRCKELADMFGCKTETLPFPYLGLPMGTTKPRMEHLIGILERIDRRLTGISTTLSYDGRLV